MLLKVRVRPKVEYAGVVWSPYLKSDISRLEKVQKRATRCVNCIAHLPYRERLWSLNLICLQIRRKRVDLIYMWKFLNGVISCNFALPPSLRPSVLCRGHSLGLLPPSTRPPKTKFRSNFFTERIIQLWNSLPNDIVTAPSLATFKGRLNKYWTNEMNLQKCACDTPNGFCVPLSSL